MLPGLPANRSGAVLSVLVVAAVLLSRLLLLPEGPWEQDEALFAAGVLDFDVTRHRPHPPGFPGWIAIGKLLLPLAGEPVLALQLASSVASTLLFWALAQLLARITPGGRATLLALAFTVSPLAWVHAGRAFSTTPAIAFAALAMVLWSRGPRAHVAGWALLTLAALVRPQLAPELGVLALAGLFTRDVGRGTKAKGLALALALGLGTAAFVLLGTPGAPAAFTDHLGRHTEALARALPWSELGIVRGLVHPWIAAAVTLGTGLGLLSALRADARRGGWLLALLAVTGWMILRQHHPGFPRYAVALLAAAMPALASGVAPLSRRLAFILTGLASIVGTAASLGILLWMHAAPLPVVAAARLATSDPETSTLAYSHGVFSFARLEAERAGVPGIDVPGPAAPLPLPPHAYALEGRTLHAMDGVTSCALDFGPAPAQAMVLGQGRFARARLVRDPVVLGEGFYTPERDDRGDRFAWMSRAGSLHLPHGAVTLQLRLDVPDDVAGAQLVVDGLAHVLAPGPLALALPVATERVALAVDREHAAGGDARSLSVRMDAAWVEGPDYAPAYGQWSPGNPRTLRAHDVTLVGFETPEVFAQERRGAWTRASAQASFPARPGTVAIRLARPSHTPGAVTLETEAERRVMEVGPAITTVHLRTDAPDGRTHLRLSSPTFVPALVREGSEDTRALGLIVYDVTFTPDDDPCRPDGLSSPPG